LRLLQPTHERYSTRSECSCIAPRRRQVQGLPMVGQLATDPCCCPGDRCLATRWAPKRSCQAPDGLLSLHVKVSTPVKLELIRRLAAAGVRSIEATSFVNPKLVPQMADASNVLQSCLEEHPKLAFPVLVPNAKGLQAALDAGAKE
ncbi:Hydroxymethylglutaryl-CoA lyase, partial [Durusdinium trenchii]